jgi:hypothetical protein
VTPLVLTSLAALSGGSRRIAVPAVPAGIDHLADWNTRSSGGDVFFKEPFDYANLSAASTHSTNPCFYGSSTGNPPSSSIMSINDGAPAHKYLRILFPPNSGGSGYSWLYTFDDNNGIQVPFTGVPHDDFFFQILVRMDGHIDFPFKTSGDDMASPKMFIIDRHNSSSNAGEVVCTNDHMRGYVQFYTGFTPSHGSQLISRSMNSANATPDFRAQPNVDLGTPNIIEEVSPMSDYRKRYGPWTSDAPSIPFASVNGSSSLAALGFPVADSALGGGIWHRNDWTVVTVYVHGAANRVRFWTSKYGDPPVLRGDTNQINFGGALNMGRGSTGYPGFQLTPFITGNTNAAGAAQPTTWIDYAGIIASDAPINHPGGFALPGV